MTSASWWPSCCHSAVSHGAIGHSADSKKLPRVSHPIPCLSVFFFSSYLIFIIKTKHFPKESPENEFSLLPPRIPLCKNQAILSSGRSPCGKKENLEETETLWKLEHRGVNSDHLTDLQRTPEKRSSSPQSRQETQGFLAAGTSES